MMIYFDHDMYMLEIYELYSAVTVEICYIYACMIGFLDFVLGVASIS